jgi:hypothetical protein
MVYLYDARDQISDFCHQELLRKISWMEGQTEVKQYTPPFGERGYKYIKAVAPKLRGDSWTNHVSISRRTNRGKLICSPPPLGHNPYPYFFWHVTGNRYNFIWPYGHHCLSLKSWSHQELLVNNFFCIL